LFLQGAFESALFIRAARGKAAAAKADRFRSPLPRLKERPVNDWPFLLLAGAFESALFIGAARGEAAAAEAGRFCSPLPFLRKVGL